MKVFPGVNQAIEGYVASSVDTVPVSNNCREGTPGFSASGPSRLLCLSTREICDDFPSIDQALAVPNGLLAVGGDLTTGRLLGAYRRGIFPWYEQGQPILWWSPDPRAVIYPESLRVSRSLKKTLRKERFEVTCDRDFPSVIAACAAPRQNQPGTWLNPEMIAAYSVLHDHGYAHSVECWAEGELVGGVYGVALGQVFFGESMFSRVVDASKVALVVLTRHLQGWGYRLIDGQVHSPHLASMGARLVARCEFMAQIESWCNQDPQPEAWRVWHS